MDDPLLAAFDRQVRRHPVAPPGLRLDRVEEPAPMVRLTPDGSADWGGGVLWSDLDDTTADAAIADAVAWFRPTGREWEWKLYGYDAPADLGGRLQRAGFTPDPEEALVVGEVEVVRARLAGSTPPPGVTIRRLHADDAGAAADWAGIDALQEAVWGPGAHERNRAVQAALAADPASIAMWVAQADDSTIVCAARVEFHAGTDFASLWGGSTLPAYRGRGIYRGLVSARADEAAARGFRYLQVDASPDSRPILERLGLRVLTMTTPYLWPASSEVSPPG